MFDRSFESAAAADYDRFMGRFSSKLSPRFAELAGVREGQRVVDVGCGPGALTAELVARVGADHVAAADPSAAFAAAARARFPGVDVRDAAAEDLPFGDRTFDAALAQLVVHFMKDPRRGIAEMARVTRRGGVVATCVWDLAGGRSPLSPFWAAAHEIDDDVEDESARMGTRKGQLRELLAAAGLHDVEEAELTAEVQHPSFDDWWTPITLGVGPPGVFARSLGAERLAELREGCRRHLPDGPFTTRAVAWAARGVVR